MLLCHLWCQFRKRNLTDTFLYICQAVLKAKWGQILQICYFQLFLHSTSIKNTILYGIYEKRLLNWPTSAGKNVSSVRPRQAKTKSVFYCSKLMPMHVCCQFCSASWRTILISSGKVRDIKCTHTDLALAKVDLTMVDLIWRLKDDREDDIWVSAESFVVSSWVRPGGTLSKGKTGNTFCVYSGSASRVAPSLKCTAWCQCFKFFLGHRKLRRNRPACWVLARQSFFLFFFFFFFSLLSLCSRDAAEWVS